MVRNKKKTQDDWNVPRSISQYNLKKVSYKYLLFINHLVSCPLNIDIDKIGIIQEFAF